MRQPNRDYWFSRGLVYLEAQWEREARTSEAGRRHRG
jgi:hypothetical protein